MDPKERAEHFRRVEERRRARLQRPSGDIFYELPAPGSKRRSVMRDDAARAALVADEAVANGWTDPPIGAQAGTLAEDEDAGEDTLFSVAAKNRPISDNLAKLVKDALREAALKVFEHAGPDLLSLSHRGILSLILDPHVTSVHDRKLVPPYFLREHKDKVVWDHFLLVWEEGVVLLLKEAKRMTASSGRAETRSTRSIRILTSVTAPPRDKSRLIMPEPSLAEVLHGVGDENTPEPSNEDDEQPPLHPAESELAHYIGALSVRQIAHKITKRCFLGGPDRDPTCLCCRSWRRSICASQPPLRRLSGCFRSPVRPTDHGVRALHLTKWLP